MNAARIADKAETVASFVERWIAPVMRSLILMSLAGLCGILLKMNTSMADLSTNVAVLTANQLNFHLEDDRRIATLESSKQKQDADIADIGRDRSRNRAMIFDDMSSIKERLTRMEGALRRLEEIAKDEKKRSWLLNPAPPVLEGGG